MCAVKNQLKVNSEDRSVSLRYKRVYGRVAVGSFGTAELSGSLTGTWEGVDAGGTSVGGESVESGGPGLVIGAIPLACSPALAVALSARPARCRTKSQYARPEARTTRQTHIMAQIPNGRSHAFHSVMRGSSALFHIVPVRATRMETTAT